MFSNDLMTKDLYPGYKENTQNAITKKKCIQKWWKIWTDTTLEKTYREQIFLWEDGQIFIQKYKVTP